MTATLKDVDPPKKKSELSPEEAAAAELVKLAKEQGLSRYGVGASTARKLAPARTSPSVAP